MLSSVDSCAATWTTQAIPCANKAPISRPAPIPRGGFKHHLPDHRGLLHVS